MKKLKWAAVVLSVLCLFACGNSVNGSYYNIENQNEYIQLLKDGKFYLKTDTQELSGKYVVDGKVIVLNPGSKMAAQGTIAKDIITDNDGTKWKKR
jgi:hypothetical protein